MERNINVREIHQLAASCTPPPGTWPETQACALAGNQTSDPLLYRPLLNPLSYTSQSILWSFFKMYILFHIKLKETLKMLLNTKLVCKNQSDFYIPAKVIN